MPAATPNREAVSARIFETVCRWRDAYVSIETLFYDGSGRAQHVAVGLQGKAGRGLLTRALCWTLSVTIGWMAISLSSFMMPTRLA